MENVIEYLLYGGMDPNEDVLFAEEVEELCSYSDEENHIISESEILGIL